MQELWTTSVRYNRRFRGGGNAATIVAETSNPCCNRKALTRHAASNKSPINRRGWLRRQHGVLHLALQWSNLGASRLRPPQASGFQADSGSWHAFPVAGAGLKICSSSSFNRTCLLLCISFTASKSAYKAVPTHAAPFAPHRNTAQRNGVQTDASAQHTVLCIPLAASAGTCRTTCHACEAVRKSRKAHGLQLLRPPARPPMVSRPWPRCPNQCPGRGPAGPGHGPTGACKQPHMLWLLWSRSLKVCSSARGRGA